MLWDMAYVLGLSELTGNFFSALLRRSRMRSSSFKSGHVALVCTVNLFELRQREEKEMGHFIFVSPSSQVMFKHGLSTKWRSGSCEYGKFV